MNEEEQSKAVEYYNKHLARCRAYNEKNKDKINQRSKDYFKQLKADPEKYKTYLENKRKKYKEQNPPFILPEKKFE